MKHNKRIAKRVETLGTQLGLQREQIQNILEHIDHDTEQSSLSIGPPDYPGGYYGSVSINDFHIRNKQSSTPEKNKS